jgi:hypothetical protein
MSSCQSQLDSHTCSIAVSYLRPSSTDALVPWVVSSLLLILHLPLVLVRVLRWEKAQVWSLAMATFSIVLTSLAYTSTQLQAAKVQTWTPLTLVLDVGSVLQIFILLIEKDIVVADGRSVLGRAVGWMRHREAVPRLLPDEEEFGYPLRRTDSDSSIEKMKNRSMNPPFFSMLIIRTSWNSPHFVCRHILHVGHSPNRRVSVHGKGIFSTRNFGGAVV